MTLLDVIGLSAPLAGVLALLIIIKDARNSG